VNHRIDIDFIAVTHCQHHKVFASGGVLLIALTPATQLSSYTHNYTKQNILLTNQVNPPRGWPCA